MNEAVNRFERFWADPSGRYFLLRSKREGTDDYDYCIIDEHTHYMAIIEDDDLADAVVAKMLQHNCRILDALPWKQAKPASPPL